MHFPADGDEDNLQIGDRVAHHSTVREGRWEHKEIIDPESVWSDDFLFSGQKSTKT